MNIISMPVGMLGTNCYLLVSAKGGCAIIDPGAQAQKILALIEKEEWTPQYILLTHGHHDHIGAVAKMQKAFPSAVLHIGEGDMEQLTDPSKSYAVMRGLSEEDAIIQGAQGVKDGDVLTLDELSIQVVDTPGHTKGGVCYVLEDVIFSGDTLFWNDIGRCDLYGGDYEVMLQSLKKLAALQGNYTVYPGHGEATTLEHERKNNRYMNA